MTPATISSRASEKSSALPSLDQYPPSQTALLASSISEEYKMKRLPGTFCHNTDYPLVGRLVNGEPDIRLTNYLESGLDFMVSLLAIDVPLQEWVSRHITRAWFTDGDYFWSDTTIKMSRSSRLELGDEYFQRDCYRVGHRILTPERVGRIELLSQPGSPIGDESYHNALYEMKRLLMQDGIKDPSFLF